MPQATCLPPFRRTAQWLRTAVLAMTVLLIAAACSSSPAAAPQPEVITDKGTPFADLLVPKLQASVTDGAIGVAVDSPVTVSAGDGVLGQVSLTNEAGELVDGRLDHGLGGIVRLVVAVMIPLAIDQHFLNDICVNIGL